MFATVSNAQYVAVSQYSSRVVNGRTSAPYDEAFTILSTLNLTVEYFEGYIGKVARVYSNQEDETWYIQKDDEQFVEIDPDQLWFWTPAWQAGEKEVDRERAEGLTKHFTNIDDLIDFLNK